MKPTGRTTTAILTLHLMFQLSCKVKSSRKLSIGIIFYYYNLSELQVCVESKYHLSYPKEDSVDN